jgi:magnesium transporter
MAVISVEQNEISVRQTETTKQLTVMATIFLPLTVITGFFGMNFGWLVHHLLPLWAFLVYGLGSFVVSFAVLWVWFRRRGYLLRSVEAERAADDLWPSRRAGRSRRS